MALEPATLDLKKLFPHPDMFDSAEDWRDEGFQIVRAWGDKMMVASHDKAKGFLFKKYNNNISLREQRERFERRLRGADTLRSIIAKHRLEDLVVPRKWLRELPDKFSSSREKALILIVEKLPILAPEQSEREHLNVDRDVLRELCTIFFYCKSLDFTAKNAPFLKDGRVGFIDTEYVELVEGPSKSRYMKNVEKYLSGDRAHRAKKIFRELKDKR